MFWPSRRSILYLARTRFVMASHSQKSGEKRQRRVSSAPSSVPRPAENRQVANATASAPQVRIAAISRRRYSAIAGGRNSPRRGCPDGRHVRGRPRNPGTPPPCRYFFWLAGVGSARLSGGGGVAAAFT